MVGCHQTDGMCQQIRVPGAAAPNVPRTVTSSTWPLP